MNDFRTLFIIFIAIVVAPFLTRAPFLRRTPLVAIELILGIILGPGVANLVRLDEIVGFLREMGLVFLFFQAGFESRRHGISSMALRLGVQSWAGSFLLAAVFSTLLYLLGLVQSPLLLAIILPTTAFGILIPMLRDSRDLGTVFGDYLLGLAAFGELCPLILASIVLAKEKHHIHQIFLSLGFLALAAGSIFLACQLLSRVPKTKLADWLTNSGGLAVKSALLILLAYVCFANTFGMEAVIGAYAAGMVVALLESAGDDATLEERLTTIGSDCFIPVFFVASGVAFDLRMLAFDPASLLQFLLFCCAIAMIRLIPLNIYRARLAEDELPALGLLSAATLPLVVALSHLGVQTGQIRPDTATALTGAALVTVTVFPAVAYWIRVRPSDAGRIVIVDRAWRSLADGGSIGYNKLRGWFLRDPAGRQGRG
jgi:Kef-type K+ transport system membrane component KefB